MAQADGVVDRNGTFPGLRDVRRFGAGALAAVAFVLALLSWGLASPVGSSPDEDFHIANLYCMHDQSTCRSDDWDWPWGSPWWTADPANRTGPEYKGAKKAYPDLWKYSVPRALPCYVTNGGPWFAPDPAVPATCLEQEDPRDDTPASLDDLDKYPPHYYRVMSAATGETIRESVARWRAINVVVAVVMIGLSLLLSAPRYRRPIAVGALVASVPLGIFLVTSLNPTSWLVVGAVAFVGPALTALRSRDGLVPQVLRAIFLAVSAFMMVAGRSEGPTHLALLVAVVLLVGLRAHPAVYALLGALGALGGLMAWDRLQDTASSSAKYTLELLTAGQAPGSARWEAFVSVPEQFFGATSQLLGWLAVPAPPPTSVLSAAAFWGAVILGLAVMFWRKALALLLVAMVMVVVPGTMIAGGWQTPPTRYFLPLVYLLVIVALLPRWGSYLPRWTWSQWAGLATALVVANSFMLLYFTVRYVSGINPGTTAPWKLAEAGTPQWWWGGWLSPYGNWVLGSVAFAVGIGVLFSMPALRAHRSMTG